MTDSPKVPAWLRQVGMLLGVFGAGLVLVVLVGLVAPQVLRISPVESTVASNQDDVVAAPAEIAVAWTDGGTAGRRDGAGGSLDSPEGSTGGDGGSDGGGPDGSEGPPDEIVVEGERSPDDAARDGRIDPAPDEPTGEPTDGSSAGSGDPDGGEADGDGSDDGGAGSSGDASTGAGAADTSDAVASEAGRVLELVNAERAAAGCPAASADGALDDLAQGHSADMAERDYFDHTDPDGGTPWDRAATAGVVGLAAENIARGQADADAVVEAWMNSPGHRANILECSHTRHGLGVVLGAGGPWWTQTFGR